MQLLQYMAWSNFHVVEIWHGQIPSESFGNLHSLHVNNCASLLKVLPSYLLRSLQNLEVVILKKTVIY